MAIPVIDISKLNGEERAETMAQIANGCAEWGFFQLVNHGIPVELLERVKKVSSQCYKLEREESFKDSVPVQSLNELLEGKSGNVGQRLENVDWEDVFLLHDQNEWPSQPPEFKETMMEYRRELKKLAEKMMEIMDENLGLEKGYIQRAFSGGDEPEHEPFFGTKVSHYPPCPPNPNSINIKMAKGAISHEMVSPLPPTRLWKAIAKDPHNLMPKIMPQLISSIVVLEGDGGVGTIKQANFTDAIKDFSYWKERVDEIDEEKRVYKYSVIEGGLIGKKVKSSTFKLQFEDGANGGSVCKLDGEFEAIEDGPPMEDERIKETIVNMEGMFKAVEGYLVANPDAYV